MMPSESKQRATEVLAHLVERFPHAFFGSHASRRALKIGIRAELVPLIAFGWEDLELALRYYTRSDGYLKASTEGAVRIDLDGNAAGTVEAKHAAHAQKVLAERDRWRAKRNAASEQQQAERNVAQDKPVLLAEFGKQRPKKPARKPQAAGVDRKVDSQRCETTALARQSGSEAGRREVGAREQSAPDAPARIGFAELRASAAQRKTAAG